MVSDSVSPWPDTAAIEKRHGLCLAGPNCDTCRWLATVYAERAKHAAELATLQAKYDEEERRADGYADQLDRCYLAEGELASLKEANAQMTEELGRLQEAYMCMVDDMAGTMAERRAAVTLAGNAPSLRAQVASLKEVNARLEATVREIMAYAELHGRDTDEVHVAVMASARAALAPTLPKVHCSQCGIATIWNRLDAAGRPVCGDYPSCQPPQPTGDIIHNPGLSSVTVTAEQAAQLLGKPTGDGQAKQCATCKDSLHVCDESVAAAEQAHSEGRGYIPGCVTPSHPGYRPCPECRADGGQVKP